jgi:hypothetical protein
MASQHAGVGDVADRESQMVTCVSVRSFAAAGLALAAVYVMAPATVRAADIYAPDRPRYSERYERYEPRERVYAPPRYLPPPVERRVEIDDEDCRVFVKRAIDAYGREVLRRVRVCEEAVGQQPRRWAGRSGDDYERRPYFAPGARDRMLDDEDWRD